MVSPEGFTMFLIPSGNSVLPQVVPNSHFLTWKKLTNQSSLMSR
jgi:hypothetical protein